jgi:hypothetical protein
MALRNTENKTRLAEALEKAINLIQMILDLLPESLHADGRKMENRLCNGWPIR